MQISLDVFSELAIDIVISLQHLVVLASFLLTRSYEFHVVFAIEKTGHFTSCQQSIHPFEESRSKHIRLIKDKTDLFALNSSLSHYFTQVLIKVVYAVVAASFDLENLKVIYPRDEPSQGCLTDSRGTN
jgi:hypothetical protein